MTDEIRDIINAYGREMMYVETMHEDVFDRRGQASIDYLRSKGFSSCFLHEGEKHHFYVERAGVRTYWQETAQMSIFLLDDIASGRTEHLSMSAIIKKKE